MLTSMASFTSSPAFGRRKAQIGYGAHDVKESLVWSVPDEEQDDRKRRLARSVRNSSALHGVETAQAYPERSSMGQTMPVYSEPPGSPTAEWKSEARDSYAYFVPVPIAPPPAPEAAPPPPPPPPQYEDSGEGEPVELADEGMQTEDTTFIKHARPPSPPLKPKEKKVVVKKPPFHAYGRGNVKPLNNDNHLASYNLMPLLHKVTDKDVQDAKTNGKHRVYDSAVVRLQFDAEAYSGRGLANMASRLAATSRGESVPTPALRITDPADKEVTIIDIGGGRREVAIQRSALLVEDSILNYHTTSEHASKAPLDLALLELKSGKYRSLMGFSWGCGTSTMRVDARGNAVQPYDPIKAKQKREPVKPPMAFGASMIKTVARERPPPAPKGFGATKSRVGTAESGAGYLWSLPSPSRGGVSIVREQQDGGGGMGTQTDASFTSHGGPGQGLSTSALDMSTMSHAYAHAHGHGHGHGGRQGGGGGPQGVAPVQRARKPVQQGKGLLSRLSPPRGNPGFSSSAARYRMQWDAGRGADEDEEEEWGEQQDGRASRVHSMDGGAMSPHRGRRSRPHSADSAMLGSSRLGGSGGMYGRGEGAGDRSVSPTSLQNTMRAAERYDGGTGMPLDARMHSSARRAAHHRGGGRFAPHEPETVDAVTHAAMTAQGVSGQVPGAKVVMYGGKPTVVMEYTPTEGRPTREHPGAMIPAIPMPGGPITHPIVVDPHHALHAQVQGQYGQGFSQAGASRIAGPPALPPPTPSHGMPGSHPHFAPPHPVPAASPTHGSPTKGAGAMPARHVAQHAPVRSPEVPHGRQVSHHAASVAPPSPPAPVPAEPVRKPVAWVAGAGSDVQAAGIPSNAPDIKAAAENGMAEGIEPSAAAALGRPNWPMTDKPWKSPVRQRPEDGAPPRSLAESFAAGKAGGSRRASRKSSAGGDAPLTMSAIA